MGTLDLSIVFFVFFAKYYVLSNHNNFGRGRDVGQDKQKRYRQTLFVTDAGSQLTFEMGERGGEGINKNVTDKQTEPSYYI